MKCDPFLLSQYRDGQLSSPQMRQVEEHLRTCKRCAALLRQYEDMSLVIRSLPAEEAPQSLWPKLLEMMQARPRPKHATVQRLALAAALLLAALSSVLLLNVMREGESGDAVVLAAYPANNAVDVPLKTSIQLEFKEPPRQEMLQPSVSIAPFVEAGVAWEGNTLVLTPKEKLQPGTTYTITVPLTSGPEATQDKRKVFTMTFITAAMEEEVPPTAGPSLGVPAPSPTQAPPLVASPVATGTPPPLAVPVVTPTLSITGSVECLRRPVRGFGKVYSENPNVARALGCALEPEKGGYFAEQFFQKGYMFWRRETRQIYVIMDSGRWAVYPDTWNEGDPSPSLGGTPPAGLIEPIRGFGKLWRERKDIRDALGWATSPERGFDGAVEPFERGTMLWSDKRVIFVLFSEGTWLRFADTFGG